MKCGFDHTEITAYTCMYKQTGSRLMPNKQPILCNCLYYTANSLARIITRIAEEEFSITGISPSHAFLMLLVNASPGIGPTELANELHLAPSTVTRLIDKLAGKGLLERRADGKTIGIYPTEKGNQAQETIYQAWHSLFERYSAILGEAYSQELTQMIDEASQKLES
jgi:DNA-binding MarR family transcriptional regulator